MKRELFEKDKDTVISNAASDVQALASAFDIGRYDMSEIARLAVFGCEDEDSFRNLYAEIREKAGLGGAPSVPLLAELCKNVCLYARERGHKLTFADFFQSEKPEGAHVAYVKNAIFDEAYRIFSGVLDNAAVTYQPSFAAACEEVYYGRVPFCILPQENSDEGVLSGFSRMAKKYELYPQYVCTVRSQSGATKLALLGHSPCMTIPQASTKNRKFRIRVSFYALTSSALASVCSAAAALELSLIKTESAPLEWDDGRYAQAFVFEGTEDAIISFLTYLALEMPECSEKSVYTELS